MVHNPEGAITVLGGRGGDEVELVEFFDKLLTKPESSGSAPSNPDHGVTNVVDGPPPTNPATSTESDRESMGWHGPLSSPVLENWFDPYRASMGAHAPRPNPGPQTEFGSDNRLVVSEPPSPTEFDSNDGLVPPPGSPKGLEMTEPSSWGWSQPGLDSGHEFEVAHPPPGAASSTESENTPPEMFKLSAMDRRASKAKDSHFSGTSRDVVNAAQRESQPESKFLSRPSLFCQSSNNYFVLYDLSLTESWQFLNTPDQ